MFTVRDVFVGKRVNVLFGQPKVDDVHYVLIGCPGPPHQKILWLHVPVDQMLAMDVFQSGDLE